MPTLNYQKAKAMGATDDQILQYARKRGIEINLPDDNPKQAKKERGLLDLLSVGTSIGGGILGSAVGGPVGTVAGSAIGGGLGDLLEQVISGDKTDLGAAGKEALWSGAGSVAGLGVGKLLAGGARAATGSKILKNIPKESRYIDKIDDLTEFALSKGAPKGSYMDKARGYSRAAKTLGNQRKELVAGSGGASRASLYKGAKEIVDTDELKDLKVLLNRINEGKVSDSKLLTFKEGLNKTARKATKKGRSAQALQEVSDEVLNKNAGYGAATKQIGKTLTLKDTYTEAARQGTKIPLGIGSIPTGPLGGILQKTGDSLTRSAYGAGNNSALMQLLGQGSTRPFMPKGGDQMPTDTSGEVDGEVVEPKLESSNKGQMSELLKKVALMDLMNGGKNVTKIIALSKFIEPPMDATSKGRVQQMKDATNLVDQLEGAYVSASKNGQTGFGVGPIAGLLGGVSGGAINQDAALYNSLREGFTALIARATGEKGVLTDADAARALKLIPSLNDSSELAANKLNQIRQIFSNAQGSISSSTGDSNDIMSLLEGMQ